MTRGDIVTVAGAGGYSDKPRPAVILQSDDFPETGSLTVCLLTTRDIGAPLFRLELKPNDRNGLATTSWIMIDKVQAVPRTKIGRVVGSLENADLARMERALLLFLGFAG